MTVQRCPGPELLLLAAHDLLDDDDDGGAVRAHLEACDACRRARAALDVALVAPPLPFAPDELLPELRAKLEAHDALQTPPAPPALAGVKLLCTFCKDGLPPPETVYCASCLAPHHADCFGEHGRCAAPGCQGTLVVRTAAPPARAPRRRGWLLVASGLFVGGGAVAALTLAPRQDGVVTTATERTPAADPVPEGVTTTTEATPTGPAGEPVWITEYKQVLATRKVTLNFPGTSLAEVVSFMQDITGLNVYVAPDVDAEATQVTLRVREIPLEDALRIIVEQTGMLMVFENESIVLRLPGIRRVLEPRYPAARPAPQAPGDPAPVVPDELRAAWFAPAPGNSSDPGMARARAYLEAFEAQKVTLNFDQTPLAEAVDFLRDIARVPVRIEPLAAPHLKDVTVSLRLRDITLRNALSLMAASADELVVDVDRDGFLVRPHDVPSLERRLEACGAIPAEGDAEVLRRLEQQLISLNMEQTELDEFCDFMRDITGLNFVVDPAAQRAEGTVTLQRQSTPLREVLDAALLPLGLGLRVGAGVVRIVPRSEATLRPELAARVASVRGALLARSDDPLTLGELALALERATSARVVFTERTSARRARVRLQEAQTVEAALALAERQAGLRHGWSFLPGTDDLVLMLDAPGPGPLLGALALLAERSPWAAAPASATAALEARRAELRGALGALSRSNRGLDGALRASERLRDALRGHATLARAEAATDDVRDVVDELRELHGQMHRGEPLLRAAEERAAAVEARLADPRLSDEERRQAEAQKVELLRELAVYRRDASLEEARRAAQQALHEERLRSLGGGAPGALRAVAAARGELSSGRGWDEVFASGFGAWWDATSAAGVERLLRGLRALDALDGQITTDDQGLVVSDLLEGRRPSGLAVGQRVVAVKAGGSVTPVSTVVDLVDALGVERAAGEALQLSTLRDGAPADVTIPRGD